MKTLLTSVFICMCLIANGQTNLIQDANFEATDLSRLYVESDTNPATAFGWAKVVQVSWTDSDVKITLGNDAVRLKTAQMELVGTNSIPNSAPYRAFIAQRVGVVAASALYKFSFWAKAINGTPTVRIFVKLDAYTNQYIIFDTDKPTNSTSTYTAYCKNLTPTTQWTYFENVVDLSKKTTSRSAINNTQAIETTESERTNVAVCFQNNAAGSTVQIDEVEFSKVVYTKLDNTSTNSKLNYKVAGNQVFVGNAEGMVDVINIAGRKIMSINIADQKSFYIANKGIYILKFHSNAYKICIQ